VLSDAPLTPLLPARRADALSLDNRKCDVHAKSAIPALARIRSALTRRAG